MTEKDKFQTICDLVKKNKIKLSFEIWNTEDDRDEGYGYVLDAESGDQYDFKKMVSTAWSYYKESACVEIVYGNNNQTIWHVSPETPDGIIDDFDYKEFVKYNSKLNKGK